MSRREEATRELTAELRFGVRLVERFARFSEDTNPIHIDRIAARRLLYGERVAHGMLVTLWALACLREALPDCSSIKSIAGSLKAPVRVGTRARIVLHRDAGLWRAVVRCGSDLCASFRIETRAAHSALNGQSERSDSGERKPRHPQICHERREAELSQCSGTISPLEFQPGELFRGLAGFDRAQCQMLAALSRLVGMECPGLHSALVGFDIDFAQNAKAPGDIAYKTASFDPRFKFLSLKLSGGVFGRVDCLVRPAPAEQMPMAEVMELVPYGLFEGKHALVVGGSRGIGEVIAKGFAAGGGRCTLTYASGAEDAARVVADINRVEPKMASNMRWDLLGSSPDLVGRQFTHAFFLASPPIRKGGVGGFDGTLYRRFQRYYVAGLELVLRRFAACADQEPVFVFVSSTFVESAPPGFAEYANAKREGELICQQLGDLLKLKVKVWRLPPLRTDQTSALADGKVEEVCPVVANRLKDLVSSKFA
jgi:hypothetical protein